MGVLQVGLACCNGFLAACDVAVDRPAVSLVGAHRCPLESARPRTTIVESTLSQRVSASVSPLSPPVARSYRRKSRASSTVVRP